MRKRRTKREIELKMNEETVNAATKTHSSLHDIMHYASMWLLHNIHSLTAPYTEFIIIAMSFGRLAKRFSFDIQGGFQTSNGFQFILFHTHCYCSRFGLWNWKLGHRENSIQRSFFIVIIFYNSLF